MERRYYSNYTMDNNAYNYHDVDTRRNEYADVRDRTPSPLRNIQQRRSYEVCANRRLYEEPEAQDHRMYGRDIHTRRNMNTGRDNHTEHKMHVYPRRSHVFNGTRVDVPRSNSGQPHLADGYIRGPSTVTCGTQVKRDIPPRWLNPPDSGRPVNKQRRIDRCRDNRTVGGKYENPTNRILHSEDRKRVHGPTGKVYQSRSEATFCSRMTGALRPSTSTAARMTEALRPSTSTASTAGRMPEALRPSTSTAGETMCVNPKTHTRVAQIPKVPERQGERAKTLRAHPAKRSWKCARPQNTMNNLYRHLEPVSEVEAVCSRDTDSGDESDSSSSSSNSSSSNNSSSSSSSSHSRDSANRNPRYPDADAAAAAAAAAAPSPREATCHTATPSTHNQSSGGTGCDHEPDRSLLTVPTNVSLRSLWKRTRCSL
uniref:vitellogenin-like n=1 Tax=Epinephelus lanceolatus TaxID=310571 RepID=UPI001447D789|nr:vitellogenin-like [Epinephelus lanceolatus]